MAVQWQQQIGEKQISWPISSAVFSTESTGECPVLEPRQIKMEFKDIVITE